MVFKSIPCLSRTPNALKSDIIKHLSHHGPDGYIKYITDEIVKAIGDEKYEVRVCCLNVNHSCEIIEYSLQIQKEEKEYGLKVLRAIYHLESGEIDFLRKSSKLSATTSVALYASLLKREKARP